MISEADLLIHVVDGSSKSAVEQMAAVREVLAEIGAGSIEEVVVLNKMDRVVGELPFEGDIPDAIYISAKEGTGVPDLLSEVSTRLRRRTVLKEVSVPIEHGEILAFLHREGEILSERSDETNINVLVRLDPASLGLLEKMLSDRKSGSLADGQFNL